MTTRRDFICSIAAGAAAAALPKSWAEEAKARKLNVLMIAVDDLRPEMGCYGGQAKTPNMDRIAADGLRFDRAYCQQALCSPSRTALLTGRRPESTGILTIGPHFRSTLPDVVTLPQHFRNNGYVTRAVGKVYHEGLDDKLSWSAPHVTGLAPRYGAEGTARQKARIEAARKAGRDVSDPKKRPKGPAWEAADVPDDGLLDGANCSRAVGILREIHRQPFFMAVGFSDPHIPYVAPKKCWDLYDPAQIRLLPNQPPPRDAPKWALNNLGEVQQYLDVPQQDPLPEDVQRRLYHGYLAATSYVDAQIGRLLATVEQLGVRDRTMIVLWGDNGYQLGEHGWWSNKHTCYETSTRVPLLVSLPGRKTAGQGTDAIVELVDLYPTLAAVCGLPAPTGVEGCSFAPLIETPARRWKRAAFSVYPRGGYLGVAMRSDRYRLVEWSRTNAAPVYELYDHLTDPAEGVNVAGRPEYAETVRTLAAQLKGGWKAALPGPP